MRMNESIISGNAPNDTEINLNTLGDTAQVRPPKRLINAWFQSARDASTLNLLWRLVFHIALYLIFVAILLTDDLSSWEIFVRSMVVLPWALMGVGTVVYGLWPRRRRHATR